MFEGKEEASQMAEKNVDRRERGLIVLRLLESRERNDDRKEPKIKRARQSFPWRALRNTTVKGKLGVRLLCLLRSCFLRRGATRWLLTNYSRLTRCPAGSLTFLLGLFRRLLGLLRRGLLCCLTLSCHFRFFPCLMPHRQKRSMRLFVN